VQKFSFLLFSLSVKFNRNYN